MGTTPTLLLTRPLAQSRGFAAACRAEGWTGAIEIAPILSIVPVPMPNRPTDGTTLIFTSANGVAQASAQHDLTGFQAIAVGDKTADAARAFGMNCESAEGNAEDLVALIGNRNIGPLLHLMGAHSRGDVAHRLRAQGQSVQDWVVYDQVAVALGSSATALLNAPGRVVLPLFSPRSALLLQEATVGARAQLLPIAISRATAEAWGNYPNICTVSRPTRAEMVQAVLAHG